jgi:hypothetical protein
VDFGYGFLIDTQASFPYSFHVRSEFLSILINSVPAILYSVCCFLLHHDFFISWKLKAQVPLDAFFNKIKLYPEKRSLL